MSRREVLAVRVHGDGGTDSVRALGRVCIEVDAKRAGKVRGRWAENAVEREIEVHGVGRSINSSDGDGAGDPTGWQRPGARPTELGEQYGPPAAIAGEVGSGVEVATAGSLPAPPPLVPAFEAGTFVGVGLGVAVALGVGDGVAVRVRVAVADGLDDAVGERFLSAAAGLFPPSSESSQTPPAAIRIPKTPSMAHPIAWRRGVEKKAWSAPIWNRLSAARPYRPDNRQTWITFHCLGLEPVVDWPRLVTRERQFDPAAGARRFIGSADDFQYPAAVFAA